MIKDTLKNCEISDWKFYRCDFFQTLNWKIIFLNLTFAAKGMNGTWKSQQQTFDKVISFFQVGLESLE